VTGLARGVFTTNPMEESQVRELKRLAKPTECTYCQSVAADTRDHVLAKCLFTKPLPGNLVTVPSCRACNLEKAADDEFLRDYLVTDFAGNESSTANALFHAKMRRAVSRNSSEVGRAVIGKAQVKGLYTRHGILMGEYAQAPLDAQRFDVLFQRIIGGLFFHYTGGDRIPLSYPTKTLRIMPWDGERVWLDFKKTFKLNFCGPFADVFFAACARVEEDLRSTMWLISFYQRVHFHVTCMNPALETTASVASTP
jgi:hypothetical protein